MPPRPNDLSLAMHAPAGTIVRVSIMRCNEVLSICTRSGRSPVVSPAVYLASVSS